MLLRRLLAPSATIVIALFGFVPLAMAQSDIGVTKTGPDTATAGSDVVYTVVVTNFGPGASAMVSFQDSVSPSSMTFVSLVNDPSFTCSTPSVGTSGTISCTATSLASGESATFTITDHIDPAAPMGTVYTNIAMTTCNTDPNSENDSSVAVTTIPIPMADMSVNKTGPGGAAPNTDVPYNITVTNGGPSTASTVSLTDPLPGTMTFVSITQNNGPAFDCTSHPSVGSNGTVTCTIASLAAFVSANFTLVGHIPNGTAGGTTFDNTATVATTTEDDTPDNNQSSSFLTVSSVDLAVTKSGPGTVTAGQNITYNLTLANAGPDAAVNTNLSDNTPPQTTFVSLTRTGGNTTPVCVTPSAGGTGGIVCTVGNFASGGNVTYTLVLTANASFPDGGTLTNTATATTDSFDTNLSNNSASTSATVAGITDIAVTKSGPGTITAGSNITYTITVSNNGPSPALNTQLSDPLPSGTTFVSLTPTGGPASSCTTPSVGANGTITCTWASLPTGTPATFTLIAKTPSNATGSISNTATVTTTTTDSNAGNNNSTTTATVNASADLAVTKTGPVNAAQTTDISYSIAVTNLGPSDAQTVALTDTIPANTTFVSTAQNSGPAFSCTNPPVGSGGTVSCTIATLTAGALASFTVVVHTTVATPISPLSNTATIGAATADPNSGNNTSTAVTTILPAPIPMVSPLALLLLCVVLAAAGAVALKQ